MKVTVAALALALAAAGARPPAIRPVAPAMADTSAEPSHLYASITVRAGDREAAMDSLQRWAEARGGFFTFRGQDRLGLKLPAGRERVDTLLALAAGLGAPLERRLNREDLSEALLSARAGLQAKRDMLARYMEALTGAQAGGVVEVEAAAARLQAEIEQAQADLNRLEDRLRYAEADIFFRLPDRQPPLPDGRSPFPWLNTLDLTDLRAAFGGGDRAE